MSKELDGRIALVEGWTGIQPSTLWGDADLMGFPPSKLLSFVPRWSSDLNLMWELEESLDDEQYLQYIDAIEGAHTYICGEYAGKWVIVHATAEQKAIAYLKVKEAK